MRLIMTSSMKNQAALWVLNLSDGMHSLLDVSERSGLPFNLIHVAAEALLRCEFWPRPRRGAWP